MALAFFAVSRGVTFEQITQATGVSVDDLMGAPSWLPQDVVPKIWLLLRRQLPGRALALEMAQLVPASRLTGELAHMGALSVDVRSSFRLLVRHKGLLGEALDVQLVEGESEAELRWRHPMDQMDGGHGAELFASVLMRELKSDFPGEGLLRRVEFSHQPLGPVAQYEDFFQLPVVFGCEANALVLSAEALDWPNPRADPALQLYLQQHLEGVGRSHGVGGESPFLSRVRAAVTENGSRSQFSGQALARRMGMSLRVLQRKLKAEDVSVRELLTRERIARAQVLLRDPDLSVEEIAFLLDYATSRSFRRAFERETGQTPSQSRQGLAQTAGGSR